MAKKEKKSAEKVTAKVDNIVAAYDLLTTRKNGLQGEYAKEGFKLSGLETKDMFAVLYIINALKPVAVAFKDFQKDIQEKLKPENWDEIMDKRSRFKELSTEERAEVNDAIVEYSKKGQECLQAELEKEKELEAYARISEDAFGILVKDNGHILDASDIILLKELIA